MNVSVLVVLYNCMPDDSLTISSLCTVLEAIKPSNAKVVIWNNGPISLANKDSGIIRRISNSGIQVTHVEDLENRPLSKVYNTFIHNNPSDRYLILDQDSNVSEPYLRQVFSLASVDVLVPGIIFNGRIESPTLRKIPVVEGPVADFNRFIAIGSGMCLSQKACSQFLEETNQIFDEHYALYGVDTSFFLKLQRLRSRSNLVIYRGAEMMHSLSRLERESVNLTRFRSIERAYDLGITMRRYPSVRLYLHFVKVTIKAALGSKNRPWLTVVKAAVAGRHPRCT